ncbi:receptor-type tyrosine-protein phosphatase mu-like isoform X6 [Mytilus californianus]|uniref:receptor-type tyrosine-protein phosphatase mu-like isoform X6 n=1 Tax=Mytilus californianus TaxID=6549 RepID=UPI0022471FF8|nr:receptor-type tyrosine-protein phosphatase mu-like isoform X6 [Mytilus californianus]
MEKLLICVLSLFGIFLLIGFSEATCDFGEWGGSCQYNCSTTCYYGTECSSNGGKCGCEQLHGNCYGCAKNYFGDVCNKACNQNCSLSDQCIQSGLSCGCERQLGYCNSCPKTLWGQYCDRSCSIRCINLECERTSGQCTSGCKKGYYGSDCSSTCPISCQFGCDQQTAGCFPSYCVNCNGGLPKCDQSSRKCLNGCIDGFFGSSCDKSCSEETNNNLCTKCQALISVGITVCTECQSEYYYDGIIGNCTSCSTGCKTDNTNLAKCFPDTGNCRFGCSAGWNGQRCDTFSCSLPNCESCVANQPTVCERCQTGWYLDSGQCIRCSDNCATLNSCDKTSGTCTGGCKTGWYGNKCTDNCNTNCNQGTTIKNDTEVDIAIVIGAIIGGAVVLLIIVIIVCCHCLRNKDRHAKENGSEDVLTPRSDDSLEGIDNNQFANYDEIKKDEWVMRNTIRFDTPKQNGTLIPRGGEADAHMDYYDFPPPPPEEIVADVNAILLTTEGLPPPPPTVHFSDFDGRDGIQVEMLPQYVEYMLQKDNAFETEYDGLPHGLKHPHDVALRPGNKRKNRYKNIYAYDHSRVVLQPEVIDSEDGSSYATVDNSDYINASYFDGYQDPRAYIACQGPTDEMVDDFWRMVWQLRIQNIVMLTNLIELGQIKCKKYWPDENKTERFGNIYVKFDYQETFADFILTNLIVTKTDSENTNANKDQTTTEDNARLQVKHLQFASWPDRDVPKYVTTLVEFHSKVNSLRHEGPLLIHCSAGVGRTGTFIGMDYLMDQADSEGRVSVYKCVEKMRIARPNMVQTPEQYIFLHQALAEALLTSESPVDEDEFENYYNQMQIKDPRSGLSRLQHEFEEVKTQRVKRSHEAAKAEENKHRNRHTNVLASDECRVFLWSKIKGCTDYINAIYLPSFRNKYCFIATEMPQCATIVDFCRMIFQEEVRTIVMLDNDTSGITANEHYWPESNQTMEMGPFSINVTEVKEQNDYTLRSLNFKFAVDPESKSEMLTVLDQKGTYKVNQFHYKRWSEGKVTPVSVESFVDFINAVTEWQSDSVKHPIIVYCMNGASKVGLFCLVRACMDRLQSDGDVSVVHALHHMRARRSKLVPNYEQYKFCHDCLLRQLNSDHL